MLYFDMKAVSRLPIMETYFISTIELSLLVVIETLYLDFSVMTNDNLFCSLVGEEGETPAVNFLTGVKRFFDNFLIGDILSGELDPERASIFSSRVRASAMRFTTTSFSRSWPDLYRPIAAARLPDPFRT